MFTNLEAYANARRQEIDRALRMATLEGRVIRDIPGSPPSSFGMGTIRRARGRVNAAPVGLSGSRADSPTKARS